MHQDMERWREEYNDCSDVILTIDGLQPEKGHETLYVIREVHKKRVWFAEALISSSNAEILKLIQRAKNLAQELGKPVRGWVSDKQSAFVTTIASEFPNALHRYCSNHFLRDIAKPVIEKDSHAKVQMRRKVRGLRTIEKEILAESEHYQPEYEELMTERQKYAASIVLDYCAAVRGILNDNDGGPLNPPGLKMANALKEVSRSVERNLKRKESTISSKLKRLNGCIKRGLAVYEQDRSEIEKYLKEVRKIYNTLDSKKGTIKKRLSKFRKLKLQLTDTGDLVKTHMSKTMHSFETGLFVGSDDIEMPDDNLDLERWFREPKGHERRIHGRKHAGTRIVHEGPTLLPVLDAHLVRTRPFTYYDLLPYAYAEPPESQIISSERNRIMKKASSKKKDRSC
jgi:predicted translin family RNA/ssDNA-binding protein